MNQYVKLNLIDSGRYFDRDSSNEEIEILGHFLSSDVGCYFSGFKEWAEEKSDIGCGGNITDLEKEGDYVMLKYDEYIDPQSVVFKIPKQAFIDLLNAWEDLCKQKFQQIIITYDDKRFTLEGNNATTVDVPNVIDKGG